MNTRNVLGGVIGSLEDYGFERETSLVSAVIQEVGGTKEFSSAGTIKFNENHVKSQEEQKLKDKAAYQRRFYQALKEEQARAQQAKDRMWLEEEINDISTNMSIEEKNSLLHYQASYKDRSIYQKAELRKKIIEQRRKTENQQKAAAIPSPAKQASALETAFEGASGKQGSGTANLSAHATG